MSKIFIAEVIGTAILVLFGCGAAVLMGAQIGMMGIAFAFGLSIVAAAYGLGLIAGAHLNPAVSLGMFLAGRMTGPSLLTYVAAQLVGAVIGGASSTLSPRVSLAMTSPSTALARTVTGRDIWGNTHGLRRWSSRR